MSRCEADSVGVNVNEETSHRAPAKLSVVVCTRNRSRLLKDCLSRLLENQAPAGSYEVIVIDDGSSDDTEKVVASLSEDNPVLRYHFQRHSGLNAARNAGVELARYNVVLFLDDDELAPPEYLRRVAELLDADRGLDGVGGPVKDTGASSLPTCPRCSLGDADVGGEGRRLVNRLLGGNMALRRETFDTVGLFDEDLSGRGDETEWFARAKTLKLMQDPDLWVWHRRDHLSLAGLIRHSFLQGLSLPLHYRKRGVPYRPRLTLIGRGLLHALRHRCAHGVELACRESGGIAGIFRRPRQRRA